ncbi:nucleotide exchange factor GrpE [Candidatus Kaiserbacteria bacterium]|nr:MAG: nucleotide exchange factor GrpE [Candidatus Kaiserbacteria bacterium]
MKKEEETTEEIVYEEDQGAELVKKLRAKLKKCEQEKKEYLDGWQRLKADTVNAQKNQKQGLELSQKRIVQNFVQELLPALDSFDIATQSGAWEKVDVVWRQGIEYVHAQLLTSLENSGVENYGVVGDTFDPALHEAGGHAEGGESDIIARVERRGYKMGDTVIRPAQVVVYN